MSERSHGFSPYKYALEKMTEAFVSRSSRGETGRASVTLKEVKIGTGESAKLELQIEVTASAVDVEGTDSGPFAEGAAAWRAGQEAQAEYERLRAVFNQSPTPNPRRTKDV